MLRSDYETPIRTIGEPFELGVKNEYGHLRIVEIERELLLPNRIFPHRQTIRFNSTFLECMDSWEGMRGRMTAYALPVIIISSAFICMLIYFGYSVILSGDYINALFMIVIIGLFSLLVYVHFKLCQFDLFGYTHYPVRFNRQNKKVYAFSPWRKKIIEVDWHQLRFSTLADNEFIEVRGSVVNEDNIVVEEIVMPYREYFDSMGRIFDNLAFLKLYMEGSDEDLKQIDASICEFHDIYARKESIKETWQRIYMFNNYREMESCQRENEKDVMTMAFGMIIMIPTLFLRRLGLLCSKLPVWPQQIEDVCQIAADDPYDSTHKTRRLPAIKYTWLEIILFTIMFIITSSLFIAFLAGVAYWGKYVRP